MPLKQFCNLCLITSSAGPNLRSYLKLDRIVERTLKNSKGYHLIRGNQIPVLLFRYAW
jgi:hypothetical protein